MRRPSAWQGGVPLRRAAWPAGAYLAASAVWIVGSDRLLHLLVDDPAALTAYQSVKGLGFVAASATFVLWAVGRELSRRRTTERSLRDALARERELTRRFRRLDQMKNDFLVGVSHELRTPLTTIVGFAHALHDQGDRLSPEASEAYLDAILRGSDRLGRHMDRLLDTKRLTETFDRPAYEEVDLADLARRVADRLETPDHPISVGGEPAVVQADPNGIAAMLENLVDNAVRHTPVATPVRIRFVEGAADVEVHVSDDGPGIPDELKPYAFRAFEKGTVQGHAPGLGLGLFLVERYVQQHGGSVRAEDNPSGGTRIRVVLPKEPLAVREAPPEPEPRPAPARERRGRIPTVRRLARVAGVGREVLVAPGDLARRRRELAGILAAALVVLPATVAASLLAPDLGWVPGSAVPVLRGILVAFGPVVGLYALEKERAIRRLERALAEEQTLRSSLETRLRDLLGKADEGPEVTGVTAFRRVAEEALPLLGADHASILAVRGPELLVVAEAGQTRGLVGEHGPFERSIAGHVARTGEPLLLSDDMDVIDMATRIEAPLARDGLPPRSAVCAPVRLGAEVVAVLNVNILDADRSFDDGDLRLLTIFTEQAEALLPTDALTEDARAGA